ncbi:MAG: hypothetical protein CMJ52_09210 [Planctomycetaceae bacterium]|nr:hypothetical protein [Planctomycetaceae bacterium]
MIERAAQSNDEATCVASASERGVVLHDGKGDGESGHDAREVAGRQCEGDGGAGERHGAREAVA